MPSGSGRRRGRTLGSVLVVDDVDANLRALSELLASHGYDVRTARDGQDALDAVTRDHPDLVLSDVRMPKRDGFELCRALRSASSTRLLPIVLMTGLAEEDDRIRAIEAGANDFITKPIDQAELKARLHSLMQIKRFTDDLDSAETVLRSLALMIESRDAYTEGHCQRLSRYATQLGTVLGLDEEDLVTLGRGGYFHDIGKIALPDAILLKPGPLTAEEFTQVRQHPVIGDRLCGDLRALRRVRTIVRHHHERQDGSGYPDGLRGDDVPLVAQIIGIVDTYDAMTTDRPYRAARAAPVALEELTLGARRGWYRQDLVEAFVGSLAAA